MRLVEVIQDGLGELLEGQGLSPDHDVTDHVE